MLNMSTVVTVNESEVKTPLAAVSARRAQFVSQSTVSGTCAGVRRFSAMEPEHAICPPFVSQGRVVGVVGWSVPSE